MLMGSFIFVSSLDPISVSISQDLFAIGSKWSFLDQPIDCLIRWIPYSRNKTVFKEKHFRDVWKSFRSIEIVILRKIPKKSNRLWFQWNIDKTIKYNRNLYPHPHAPCGSCIENFSEHFKVAIINWKQSLVNKQRIFIAWKCACFEAHEECLV